MTDLPTPLEEYRANKNKAYRTRFGPVFWDRFADWAEGQEIKAKALFPLRVRVHQVHAYVCPSKTYLDEMEALANIEERVAEMRSTMSDLCDQFESLREDLPTFEEKE